MSPPLFIIACSRPWMEGCAERLSRSLAGVFRVVSTTEELTALGEGAEMIFFPFWSSIIPQSLFERTPCIVFHMTDLPFGRGGSPLQNLISRGIYETKMSAISVVKELDAGPVYLKRALSLHGSAEEIYIRAGRLIEEMIATIIEERPEPVPQDGEPVIFRRRKPEEGDISELSDLVQVYDRIRMLDAEGYPRAFLDLGKMRLEFSRASLRTDGLECQVRITLKEER